jgi:hypothetical protein
MARDERFMLEILHDHHAWVDDKGTESRANLVGLDL